MGYRGRTVLIETPYGRAEPTKDGYKTLQSLFFENPVEDIALEIVKEASQKTVDFAGDSTTSTVVLTEALLKNSIEALEQGRSAIDIKIALENDKERVAKYLDKLSSPITNELIKSVALTSANGEQEIADIVTEAFIKSGKFGAVSHFRSENEETYLDHLEGTLLEAGYQDERFINSHEDRTCTFSNNPLMLISNIEFKTIRQIQPFLEYALMNQRELVIVSEMNFGVRDVILQNVLSKKLPITVVNVPSFGIKKRDMLSDLALLCGTQIVSTLSGDDFAGREESFLGTCEKVVIGKTDTIVTPSSRNELVDSKIAELKKQLETTKNVLEKKYLADRISKLHGGVSIIKVGAIIESELQEKIDRVDDAVCAVRSAREEGVVAGGGVALHSACSLIGLDTITKKSLTAPFSRIVSNSGKTDITFDVYPLGYDVKNFDQVDMFDAGIIDATKAIKHAYINAVAAATTILMSDYVITNKRMYNE